MNKTLRRIIDWLKEANHKEVKAEKSPGNRRLSVKDEPWMQFNAEWQDWGFDEPRKQVLYIGYSFEMNGDLVADPDLKFTIEGDEVTHISFAGGWGGCCDMTNDPDPYPYEFLECVWDRHFAPRCESVEAS